MEKAVAYIRVSTKEQDADNQKHAIEQFAEKRGIEVIAWFVDEGVSGSVEFSKRDGAKALIEFLKNNKVYHIVVFSIDRLGRNMEDTVTTIQKLEDEYNVKILSVKEEFLQTLDENIRKLILSILSWVAEFERKRIRERQLAAWESGKAKGRPAVVSDEELIRWIKKYKQKGYSYKTIYLLMREHFEKKGKKFISYSRFKVRVAELKKKGLIKEVVV